jgi:hypothetical protein
VRRSEGFLLSNPHGALGTETRLEGFKIDERLSNPHGALGTRVKP